MISISIRSLPEVDRYIIVAPSEFESRFSITGLIHRHVPACEVVLVDGADVQPAQLCLAGARYVGNGEALLVSTGDFYADFDPNELDSLIFKKYDTIAWTYQMRSTVKKAINSVALCSFDTGNNLDDIIIGQGQSRLPHIDAVLAGTYLYSDSRYFFECAEKVSYDGKNEIGGGFPACLKVGLEAGQNIGVLPTNSFIPFGSPFDLQLYEAWEEYFYTEPSHPYKGIVGDIPCDV